MHPREIGDSELDRYPNISVYNAYHVVEKFKEISLNWLKALQTTELRLVWEPGCSNRAMGKPTELIQGTGHNDLFLSLYILESVT